MPITAIGNAIAAYNATAKVASGDVDPQNQDAAGGVGGSDFASMLREGVQQAIDTGKKSELLSEQALAGKADIRDVVQAVNNAAMTLQTVVAVRDKVITAYNSILQMPI
ncbi:MAG TPA: flagellar hook-basal body complex protein FliE [Magnetospirillaceae bacterium]|jgi:flagellar hook-basal body complex protein FliE